MRDDRRELLVMLTGMNPTQRQFLREQLELTRVVADQRLHYRDRTLLVVEDN